MEMTRIELRADFDRSKSLRRTVVILLLIAAAALRLVALDRYPTPLHQDELSDIFDGYSIATTGADRAGDAYPILLRGMGPGDYHPGLYAYLAAASTGFGGFSIWWGRLPAALAGIATVWFVYATGRRILGDRGALLALAFITFSPIHIQYSRQAHQGACLVPLFVILCTYTCIRAIDRIHSARKERGVRVAPVPSRMAPVSNRCEGESTTFSRPKLRAESIPSPPWRSILSCGFVLGFSTNCYAGQRLTALLFSLFVLALLVAHTPSTRSKWKQKIEIAAAFTLAVALGAAPQIYAALTDRAHFFARGRTTFFRLANGPRWWLETLCPNLLANLDPRYLFLSFGEYHVLSVARLAVVTLPFLYVGLVASSVLPIIRKRIDLALIPAAIGFSLLPGLATEGQPSPMRTAGVWALYPIVAAQGALLLHQLLTRGLTIWQRKIMSNRVPLLYEQWSSPLDRSDGGLPDTTPNRLQAQRRPSHRPTWVALMLLAIAANGVYDVQRYLTAPALHARAAQPQLVALGNWVREHAADYDRVYISADGLFGYLYLAALSGMTCDEYRTAPRDSAVIGLGWEDHKRFGRFFFQPYEEAERDWSNSPQTEKWLVLTAEGPLAEFDPAPTSPLAQGDEPAFLTTKVTKTTK